MLRVGDVVPLVIDKPAAGGRMIARADGLVVLVSRGIPGERVRARVERVGKGVAYAEATGIDEPSPDRRTPAGDPLCGGCLYAHIHYPRQLELKSTVVADALSRIGRIELAAPVQVVPSPEEGYRMRARLHRRGRIIGFYREGTHEVCDARQTRQLLPATIDLLERLAAAMHSLALDEVRELELAENGEASQRVVHLVGDAALDRRLLVRVAATDGLTGLSSAGGAYGDVTVTDTIAPPGDAPVSLRRHVRSFFQGNRFLLQALVHRVIGAVPAGGDVIDLYAGVGLFATAAASRAGRVTAVEGDRIAAADLAANAARAGGSVVTLNQAVEAFAGSGQIGAAATVIVDPPRTGMSPEALTGICRPHPSRIIYVSCDVATLARDARRITDSGYALTGADAFDLFPNTPHVETVAVFDRS